MEQNPYTVQSGPSESESTTPIILFHDAGGTIIPYFSLGDLHRPVYGISNPRFEQGGKWEHGLRQMGVIYTHLVRCVLKSGPLILGGWSLGGCLALEVASRLMQLPQYTVQGVVLIDSVFPTRAVTDHYPRTVADVTERFQLPEQLSGTHRAQAQQCILHAHEMHREWKPPLFASGPPPTVLLRAMDSVSQDAAGTPNALDMVRGCKHLGWNEYSTSFLVACYDIPGNHFTIFEEPNCEQMTHGIRQACTLLESRS
ncbi:alpha/beta-hydrolase [Aspergillus indologenus CBS 114.80]|uniref:Alpha/beta-hydrolase n=1 Tax=Aspergillus indologenus CBS 114.80 TaxID=1450541 RepID=A0A2V5IBU2_9EURO|nr:alpha/beta-hydrolase [Aspergillus indologenus CBS 114.80]